MARIISPRLIGRSEELSRLVAALHRSREQGAGVLLVSGEAGIGKTRLVAELAQIARAEGATVLVGGCLPIGAEAVPNAPLAAMLRALVAEADLDDAVRDDLDRLGAAASTAQVCELVLGIFERLAPLVVVFEDLHWADATTRGLIAFLARSLTERHQVLLVATFRSDELRVSLLPLLDALQRLHPHPPERVELTPLGRARIAELAHAITGAEASDAQVEHLVRLSQGNPFYVEELLAVPTEAGVPTDLKRVVHARLTGLPEAQVQLLRLVAAAEAPVDVATLALVAGEPVERDARVLVARHALVSRAGGLELRHALVQEVLYAELLPGERERVHGAFARALQTSAPERTGEIAYHWWRAGDLERALPAAVVAGRAAERLGPPPRRTRATPARWRSGRRSTTPASVPRSTARSWCVRRRRRRSTSTGWTARPSSCRTSSTARRRPTRCARPSSGRCSGSRAGYGSSPRCTSSSARSRSYARRRRRARPSAGRRSPSCSPRRRAGSRSAAGRPRRR